METEIIAEEKRNNLHSVYRMETLNTLLLKEITSLLMNGQEINTNVNCFI
jgi:hypothetical protein